VTPLTDLLTSPSNLDELFHHSLLFFDDEMQDREQLLIIIRMITVAYILLSASGHYSSFCSSLQYIGLCMEIPRSSFLCVPKVAPRTYILQASFGTQRKRRPRYFHTYCTQSLHSLIVYGNTALFFPLCAKSCSKNLYTSSKFWYTEEKKTAIFSYMSSC
jgi:hypothetical protein